MRFSEIQPLSELFDPKHVQPIEWENDNHARAKLGEKTIHVLFMETEGLAYIEFSVDHEFQVTGRGDANAVFATVIQAIKEYVTKWKGVHAITFTAKEKSRARMYDALAKRVSKQLGWHVVPYEEMMSDPKYENVRTGSYAFAIEKGPAPEHRQASQKPQHEKFKDIWYVGSMEDTTLPLFKVAGGKGWEAEQMVLRTRPEYKGFHPMGMFSTHTPKPNQKIIDLGEYKPPHRAPAEDPDSLGAKLRAKFDQPEMGSSN